MKVRALGGNTCVCSWFKLSFPLQVHCVSFLFEAVTKTSICDVSSEEITAGVMADLAARRRRRIHLTKTQGRGSSVLEGCTLLRHQGLTVVDRHGCFIWSVWLNSGYLLGFPRQVPHRPRLVGLCTRICGDLSSHLPHWLPVLILHLALWAPEPLRLGESWTRESYSVENSEEKLLSGGYSHQSGTELLPTHGPSPSRCGSLLWLNVLFAGNWGWRHW